MAPLHIVHHTPTLLFCYTITIIFFLLIIPPANPLSFNYRGFWQGDVNLDIDAYLQSPDIQITKNQVDKSINYSVGRVTGPKQMHLWDMTSRNLTNFFTKFSFITFSDQDYYGDGLAFFLAHPKLPLLRNIKEGGGLGLVDGNVTSNSTQYPFVAVEFDTYKNGWDPEGTHVGMNFNSMKSSITKRWYNANPERRVYDCIIKYNSSTQILSVFFTGYRNKKRPIVQTLSYKVDLREYLPEWVIFGFSAATGKFFEVHTLNSWAFFASFDGNTLDLADAVPPTVLPPIPHSNLSSERKTGLLVGIPIGTVVLVIFLGCMCIFLWRRAKEKEESLLDLNMDDEFQKGTGAKRFCYNDLVRATNNFAEAEKLGQGGFGAVYKGYLKDLSSYVAIKRISRESKQGIKEYATEVKIISQLRHRNLVQLIGWCHKKNDLVLIYEFMPNGSLDSHLYHGKSFLTWPVRYNIALGLASALLYLQEEWEQCVLHRDIKPSNIMLDSSFNAKLGDFGLARLVDHEKGSQTTGIAGTRGYMAPEYFTTGKANRESDLYSFGILLLEIASGRKPIDLTGQESQVTLLEWVWKLCGLRNFDEIADPKLGGVFDEQQLERLVVVGLCCAHPDSSVRPSVREVVKVLNFDAPLPTLPQMMPVPIYLPPTIKAIFSSLSTSLWDKILQY